MFGCRGTSCIMVEIDSCLPTATYSTRSLANAPSKLWSECLVYDMKGTVFVIGGTVEGPPVNTVHRYIVRDNHWMEQYSTPPLNVARAYASACCHGNNIFVAGGGNREPIEMLSLDALDRGEASWERIES